MGGGYGDSVLRSGNSVNVLKRTRPGGQPRVDGKNPDRLDRETGENFPIHTHLPGEVRATGVRNATNVVLHPWLQDQLTQILATLPVVLLADAERPVLERWETWLGHPPRETLPPLRLILVWDNLAGHRSYAIVRWLFQHGVMPLNTPLSGSWLNMAESLQRIIVRRALAGQHPQTPDEIIAWLEDTVAGWNHAPTAFVWDGKRRERRRRALVRRLGGSAATLADRQLFVA